MQRPLPFDQARQDPHAVGPERAGNSDTTQLDGGHLQGAFRRLFARWAKGAPPVVQIEFYPYTTLRHTLRVRDKMVVVRLSDLLQTAPADVQEAMLAVLICKLLRRRVPARFQRCYREWADRPEVRKRAREVRALRGRKELTSPRGRVFDLTQLFEDLNQLHFNGKLKVKHLSWSQQKARTRLGHYDAAHRAIVINRRLDHPLVPEYVVSFVVYHEMLHAALGEECRNGRRYYHHGEFREAERRFPDYERAQRFIEEELTELPGRSR